MEEAKLEQTMRNLSPPEQKPLPTLLKPPFLQHTGNVLRLKQLLPPLKLCNAQRETLHRNLQTVQHRLQDLNSR